MKLYKYQKRGVNFLVRTKRAILGDDMGLGKTAQAIMACEESRAQRVLVICPNTLKSNWAEEINMWVSHRRVRVVHGNLKKKREVISKYNHGFLIVNIESTRWPKGDTANHVLAGLLDIRWDVIIVDEAHCLKNRESKQTAGVRMLARCVEKIYLLTGTPIMNRVDELWSLLNILDPGTYQGYWSFVQRNTIIVPMKIRVRVRGKLITKAIKKIDGKPTHPKKLRQNMANVFLRREKEEVYPDMPPKIYQQIWLDMEGEQLRLYKDLELLDSVPVDGNDTINVAGILARIVKCKQVTVSPILVGGKSDGVKIDALIDILQGTDKQVIVFSQFAEAIKLAAARLDEKGINYVTFIGATKEEDRARAIANFNTSFPDKLTAQVFLTTMQAGGVGLNLTSASLVVFLDKHWTPAINEQAVDRTRPHLQSQSVQIIELLAKDSVDEFIEKALDKKISIIGAVINREKTNT